MQRLRQYLDIIFISLTIIIDLIIAILSLRRNAETFGGMFNIVAPC